MIEQARAKHHVWRQRGIWLVCTSCISQHAQCIGMDKELVGIDEDGNPILKGKVK